VLVVGCHRSGTSAVTGALVALGLQGVAPADRMDDSASNPEHWESLGAALYAEDLLVDLGGAWDAPPSVTDEPLGPVPGIVRPDPLDILATAYPAPGPRVWKDPRACLLLPYWRAVLPGPLAAVFVWREPLAVARSLRTRDGIALADGLALWERYNRSAAAGLQGLDTYVLDYAGLLDDPGAALADVAGWLGGLRQLAPAAASWEVDAAAASIDRRLRHETAEEADLATGLPVDHRAMADWLDAHAGPHQPLTSTPPAATSPWPEAVLADRREIAGLRRELERSGIELADAARGHAEVLALLEALLATREQQLAVARSERDGERMRYEGVRTELDRMRASTSWTVTAPLRAAMRRLRRSNSQ